jgi:hypothetical protein
MTQVVGWLLHTDNLCERCKVCTAVVIATFDDVETEEVCYNCLPPGHTDLIADVLRRVMQPE